MHDALKTISRNTLRPNDNELVKQEEMSELCVSNKIISVTPSKTPAGVSTVDTPNVTKFVEERELCANSKLKAIEKNNNSHHIVGSPVMTEFSSSPRESDRSLVGISVDKSHSHVSDLKTKSCNEHRRASFNKILSEKNVWNDKISTDSKSKNLIGVQLENKTPIKSISSIGSIDRRTSNNKKTFKLFARSRAKKPTISFAEESFVVPSSPESEYQPSFDEQLSDSMRKTSKDSASVSNAEYSTTKHSSILVNDEKQYQTCVVTPKSPLTLNLATTSQSLQRLKHKLPQTTLSEHPCKNMKPLAPLSTQTNIKDKNRSSKISDVDSNSNLSKNCGNILNSLSSNFTNTCDSLLIPNIPFLKPPIRLSNKLVSKAHSGTTKILEITDLSFTKEALLPDTSCESSTSDKKPNSNVQLTLLKRPAVSMNTNPKMTTRKSRSIIPGELSPTNQKTTAHKRGPTNLQLPIGLEQSLLEISLSPWSCEVPLLESCNPRTDLDREKEEIDEILNLDHSYDLSNDVFFDCDHPNLEKRNDLSFSHCDEDLFELDELESSLHSFGNASPHSVNNVVENVDLLEKTSLPDLEDYNFCPSSIASKYVRSTPAVDNANASNSHKSVVMSPTRTIVRETVQNTKFPVTSYESQLEQFALENSCSSLFQNEVNSSKVNKELDDKAYFDITDPNDFTGIVTQCSGVKSDAQRIHFSKENLRDDCKNHELQKLQTIDLNYSVPKETLECTSSIDMSTNIVTEEFVNTNIQKSSREDIFSVPLFDARKSLNVSVDLYDSINEYSNNIEDLDFPSLCLENDSGENEEQGQSPILERNIREYDFSSVSIEDIASHELDEQASADLCLIPSFEKSPSLSSNSPTLNVSDDFLFESPSPPKTKTLPLGQKLKFSSTTVPKTSKKGLTSSNAVSMQVTNMLNEKHSKKSEIESEMSCISLINNKDGAVLSNREINIVDVCGNKKLIDVFLKELLNKSMFSLSLVYRASGMSASKVESKRKGVLVGAVVAWGGMVVYYIGLECSLQGISPQTQLDPCLKQSFNLVY